MSAREVAALEREVAEAVGTKHAVWAPSGLDALRLALVACGIKRGDEVITPAFAPPAAAEAVEEAGAVPVFVDVDARTFNMDPALVHAKITGSTRAVLPAHLFGHPADMGAILDMANTHGLTVVEDCSQSFGAHYKFARTGSFGDAGCFSFSSSLGGCGIVTTDSDAVADTLRSLQGGQPDAPSEASRAEVVRVELEKSDKYCMLRREQAARYSKCLSGLPGIRTPVELKGYFHVYYKYTILARDRDKISAALLDKAVASEIFRPGPNAGSGYKGGCCPVSEDAAGRALSLPLYPELPLDGVEAVCEVIRGCIP